MHVVGRSLTLNNAPITIVGVLPAGFDFDAIFSPGNEIDLLQPFPLTAETARFGNTLFGIGRLKPGVTAERSQADLRVISQRFKQTINYGGTLGARVTPISDALRGGFRQAFFILAGAVACVLAIACVNLSNLLLARINVRRQEFAVRRGPRRAKARPRGASAGGEPAPRRGGGGCRVAGDIDKAWRCYAKCYACRRIRSRFASFSRT